MLAKRFFYASAALFLLALTYHLGARRADAQAPSNPVVAMTALAGNSNNSIAITANGDVWEFQSASGYSLIPQYHGNVFSTPTASTPTTWGKVKADYRK